MTWTIYHNPRCSKSRATLEILQAKGIEPKVVPYLQGISEVEIKNLIDLLGVSPRELLRKKEALYRELDLDGENDANLPRIIAENPILFERPVVTQGDRGVIARPPERVEELF